jgi:hypothetical protein
MLEIKTNSFIFFPSIIDGEEVALYIYWVEGRITRKKLIEFYQVYKHYRGDVYFADKREIWNAERIEGDLKRWRQQQVMARMHRLRII